MKKTFTDEEKLKIWAFYREFRENPILLNLYATPQHRTSNTFRHVCLVTKNAVLSATKHGKDFDYHSLIRGAFLHDLFFYNWREHKLASLGHLWTHPKLALKNASKEFDLTPIEKDIITNHMWPITLFHFPKTKEGLLVSLMDKKVTIMEFFMRKKDTIIFDLDGTLLDTLPDLNNAVNYTMQKHGFNQLPIEHTKKAIGNGLQMLIKRCVPEGTSDEKYLEVLSTFREYYSSHCTELTKPYEGMDKVLKYLRRHGYKLGVITNKNIDMATIMLNKYYPNMFSAIVGSAPKIRVKPSYDMMNIIRNKLNIKNSNRILYIGDTELDYEFAKNSMVKCILVGYGYRTRKELTPYKNKVPIAMYPDEILDYVK